MLYVDTLLGRMRRLLQQPKHELSRAQLTVRYALDLGRHCARELRRDRAPEMAAALTYRTIFSLVPILLLALIIFQAFGGFEDIATNIKAFAIEQFSPTEPDARQEFLTNFEPWFDAQFDRIANLSIGGIGMVGFALLIWAALALVITTERCFNRVYKAPAGRPWHLKIPIYWAVITLGPALIGLSLYLVGQVVDVVSALPLVGGLFSFLTRFAALGATWLLLFIVYTLMPNLKVKLRCAALGALVAAILAELGKWGFKLYLSHAVTFSQLYGALGLIPLFLFWVYITWLIVLFGLELSFTLQAMGGRHFDQDEARAAEQRNERVMVDPRWLVPVVAAIGEAFSDGKTIRVSELSRRIGLPVRAVASLCETLRTRRYLNLVADAEDEEGGYSLARPPREMRMVDLLDLGESIAFESLKHADSPGRDLVKRLHQAQREAVADKTLTDLLAERAADDPGDDDRRSAADRSVTAT